MRDIFRKLYTQHKSNAKRRGIPFLLTLEEWKSIWIESGKWEQRGRGADKYCMCRLSDAGAYEVGNVFIDFGKRNISDGNLGRKFSAEHRSKIAASITGKSHPWSAGANNPMHRPEVKAKISAAISGGKHYAAKMVATPHGIWTSAGEAAACIGIPRPTVEWRCKHNKFGFAYLT